MVRLMGTEIPFPKFLGSPFSPQSVR
ncbi:Protein of unknown function [Pyronema omphalodes CBS 100304]|uniref:Uncharacterized protein n=1 Tax=Pyronema omphalodes (strain CBS 100304) TaxID=1076935 RepID=U4LM32_PYROM|nr:Protein of unknown function [Pyronema omphalodes CBS 100304]